MFFSLLTKMFKLRHQIKLVSGNGKLGFLAASITASAAATAGASVRPQFLQETTLDSTTQMQEKIPNPPIPRSLDPRFFISSLTKCKTTFQTKQVHAQVATNGILHYLLVANKLLQLYTRNKDLDNANSLFDRMHERDPVSWSVMVGGFAKDGDFSRCFETFRELMRYGAKPDNYTLPFVIKACRDTMDLIMGRSVHCLVLKHGLQLDHFVCAALVDMYAKCGMMKEAEQLFDKMPNRDLVTQTVMIGAYADSGNPKNSLALFEQMRDEGVVPDKIAMVTIVNACAKLGAMHKAKLVHYYIWINKFSLDVILGTAMIDMYAKCGCVDSAREIFNVMQHKNVVSWSAMIAAYGYHGQGKKALQLFSMMLSCGILPNGITFVSLLNACSHSGLVEDGLRFFSLMSESYGIMPDVKHYTCVVDLLGRAGRLNEASELIEDMKAKKDEGVWTALLGACRMHKRVDLAEKVGKSLLELQPQNAGHYILLSNIYANEGRWKDVARIRNLMTRRRIKKVPGYTWMEVNNIIYQFSAGHNSHPQSKEICVKLQDLFQKLELAGYVPDTNSVLHDVDEESKLGILYAHSEKLAIAFGLIALPEGSPIRISKNLRICGDCHTFSKLVSAITQREIIVRDANRFHHFKGGACSCGEHW